MYRSQQTAADSTNSTAAEVNAQPDSNATTSGPSKSSETTTTTTAVDTPPREAEPTNTFAMLLMWLPLVVAMGLWLYLRGRNQAAARARAESLTAAAKKQKKASRAQSTVASDDNTERTVQGSVPRSKGNSKKNKKDKQNKRQPAAVQPSKKANQVSASPVSAQSTSSAVAGTDAIATTLAVTNRSQATASSRVEATASAAINNSQSPVALKPGERSVDSAPPAMNKAIFEPMRKVAVSLSPAAPTETAELENSDGYQVRGRGRGRQSYSNEPQVVTTPTKVSGTRFEKLNVPAANAGLGSATNRWPAEASRPVDGVPLTTSSNVQRGSNNPGMQINDARPASTASSQAPQTARGLSAFVKKGATITEAAANDAPEPLPNSADSSSE